MEGDSEHLTTAQQEAQNTLKQMLNTLKEPDSRYYAKYGKWIERHPKLGEFCIRCVRPNVWRFLDGTWNLDALKLIGGDLKFEGRGIYFNGVLGLDRRTRFYVGQSTNVRVRIAQHLNFRYRRDNPSLHYHAIQQSKFNVFGILATLPSLNMGNHMLPGMDCPDLLLNVLEMWMCLVFQCLPQQTLEAWTASSMREKDSFGALNIASPLDSGVKESVWVDLSEWDDPLVQEYLYGDRRTSGVVISEQKLKKELDTKTTAQKTLPYQPKEHARSEQHVIQVSAPGLLLVTGAIFVGFMLLRSSSGSAFTGR